MPLEIQGPGNRADQTGAMLESQRGKIPRDAKIRQNLSELFFGLNGLWTYGGANHPGQLCRFQVATRILTSQEEIGRISFNGSLILPHLNIIFAQINPQDFTVPIKTQLPFAT